MLFGQIETICSNRSFVNCDIGHMHFSNVALLMFFSFSKSVLRGKSLSGKIGRILLATPVHDSLFTALTSFVLKKHLDFML